MADTSRSHSWVAKNTCFTLCNAALHANLAELRRMRTRGEERGVSRGSGSSVEDNTSPRVAHTPNQDSVTSQCSSKLWDHFPPSQAPALSSTNRVVTVTNTAKGSFEQSFRLSDYTQFTPLHYAVLGDGMRQYSDRSWFGLIDNYKVADTKQALTILLNDGANIDTQDGKGRTPLHYACQFCRYDIAKWMIAEARARTDIKDNKGHTPRDLIPEFCQELHDALPQRGASQQ